jgi:hypothetical protein
VEFECGAIALSDFSFGLFEDTLAFDINMPIAPYHDQVELDFELHV